MRGHRTVPHFQTAARRVASDSPRDDGRRYDAAHIVLRQSTLQQGNSESEERGPRSRSTPKAEQEVFFVTHPPTPRLCRSLMNDKPAGKAFGHACKYWPHTSIFTSTKYTNPAGSAPVRAEPRTLTDKAPWSTRNILRHPLPLLTNLPHQADERRVCQNFRQIKHKSVLSRHRGPLHQITRPPWPPAVTPNVTVPRSSHR